MYSSEFQASEINRVPLASIYKDKYDWLKIQIQTTLVMELPNQMEKYWCVALTFCLNNFRGRTSYCRKNSSNQSYPKKKHLSILIGELLSSRMVLLGSFSASPRCKLQGITSHSRAVSFTNASHISLAKTGMQCSSSVLFPSFFLLTVTTMLMPAVSPCQCLWSNAHISMADVSAIIRCPYSSICPCSDSCGMMLRLRCP